MLEKQLLAKGVKQEQIDIVEDEAMAVEASLSMAQEGDLLLIFGDDITRCWKQIVNFNSEAAATTDPVQPQSLSNVINTDNGDIDMGEFELIKDDRGVRLARQEIND